MATGASGEQEGRAAPIVIAHRGASGYVPEHTLAAYFIAIQHGADFIEPDLVMTRDGVLVARHENEIGGTTDVADHPEFAGRYTTKVIDGTAVSGWFTEDFTLAELKTLRARERIPQLRPANARFNGQFEIPTLDEVLALVRSVEKQREELARAQGAGKPARIGVYPETKHPSYFDSLGLSMEEPLVRTLRRWGYVGHSAPVFIQSFEVSNLRELSRMTRVRLVQLMSAAGSPYDFVLKGDTRSYIDLITPTGLAGVARYADAIGVEKSLIIPCDADGAQGTPTALVANAHAQGLQVHAWTFRAENEFLPMNLRRGTQPDALGDLEAELIAFLEAGVDGVFADHSDIAIRARDRFITGRG